MTWLARIAGRTGPTSRGAVAQPASPTSASMATHRFITLSPGQDSHRDHLERPPHSQGHAGKGWPRRTKNSTAMG